MSDEFRFRRAVDVRFRDIDEMGHAHHTMPFIYIEEARTAYWHEVLGRDELDFIIGEAGVRFHRRILYPSAVTVGVRTTRVGRRSFAMEYELRDAAGELLAEGWSEAVMYDYAAGRTASVPEDVKRRIAAWEPAPVEGVQPSSADTPTSASPTTAPST